MRWVILSIVIVVVAVVVLVALLVVPVQQTLDATMPGCPGIPFVHSFRTGIPVTFTWSTSPATQVNFTVTSEFSILVVYSQVASAGSGGFTVLPLANPYSFQASSCPNATTVSLHVSFQAPIL